MFKGSVSVGLPIFNEYEYIEETIQSLKRQSWKDVCFLISDNCSDDGTFELCQQLVAGDARFKLYRQEKNIGAIANFEFLFREANTEFFMWLGGHDYISDGYIERAVLMLMDHDELSMVCGVPCAVRDDDEVDVMSEAIYRFSPKRIGRYLESVRYINNCTFFHSVFRRNNLVNFEFRKKTGADNVIISHLLWFGNVHFMENEFYYRRYFEHRAETQSKRISGNDEYLSKYDYICYYLDDFATLYHGDERMKSYVENEIIHALQKNLGVQALMPNDLI